MLTLLVVFLVGCGFVNSMSHYDTLECTQIHSVQTGDDFLDYIDYYEGLSTEPAEMSLVFYHEPMDDEENWWNGEIEGGTDIFSIISSEVVDDGWVDLYGNPLSTVVFEIDLTKAYLVEETVSEFFDKEGEMSLEEGEDIWFYLNSPLDTIDGWESLNMWLNGYGWEDDYGSCSLY